MADFILLNAGANKVLDSGIAGKAKFGLSTKKVGAEGAGEWKAADVTASAITGTGYAMKEEESPAAATRKKAFGVQKWETTTHTDWSNEARSCYMEIGGVIICAWNLREGGGVRDLSAANTTEEFTPTYTQA